jgi:uncharacterized tellurite resistance protein B-like protein
MPSRTNAGTSRPAPRRRRTRAGLTLDQSIIAALIAAMDANRHVSPEEAARAHHIIWSMRRFRRRKGEAVDRLIETVRDRLADEGTTAVLDQAARTIPARMRPAVFAVAIDLMLADARLERAERAFVRRLAADLKVRRPLAEDILEVLLTKNSI